MNRIARWLTALMLFVPSMSALAGPRFSVRTISVGTAPEKPICVPEWNRVFVPIGQEPRISVFDARAGVLLDPIATRAPVDRLAFDVQRDRLFAIIGGSADVAGSIEVFERQGSVYQPLVVVPTNLRSSAFSVEMNTARGELIITDRHLAGTLDLATLNYIAAPEPLAGVNHMFIPSSGERVLVAEQESSDVLALSSDLARRELSVRNWTPAAVGYSAVRDRIYVVSPKLRILQVIDPVSGLDAHALVDLGAVSLAVDDYSSTVWVGHNATPTVRRIDSATLDSKPIEIGGNSYAIVQDAAAKRLYAIDPDASLVSVVDTQSETCESAWSVGARPRYAVVDPASHQLYTSNVGDGTVSILRPLPDPGLSDFSVSLDFIDADGVTTSRATVVPRGSDGLPLGSGRDVVIAATAGTLLGKVVDNLDGSYHQDLQSTTLVETGILTATVDTVTLGKRPRVSFARTGWPNVRVPDLPWDFTSGGGRIVINGDGFATEFRLKQGGPSHAVSVAIEVYFDGLRASVESFTDTEIICYAPAHAAGVIDLSVVKVVGDERREAHLRQGFTYVEEESLFTLLAVRGATPGTVRLSWSKGPSGPVTMQRSSARDFTSGVTVISGLSGPETSELAPSWPRIQYYRVGR